ncbi:MULTISPECIES: DNA-3-methyladenine glycosylase I [Lactobacillus]|uniref:DNA-3-methyladenine glycosylase I n=1 Tax=Lactobacillus xujianguonis TaxID=2495899 RepID=A0A437SVU5_9LACO|nr:MULTISPECIES: DNA-3-methyladenine glycosylase I [Lactobacillus]RVU71039.1 DNA-3-methyladenine glycosylase I [Lactobacillus xujianguonis]RVU76805.1 DNA-3-methyladenine glycosylase I [Lactobacillus xujianguonis]
MNQPNFANLRCPWGQTRDEIIQNFHDHEWGKMKLEDQYLFEMLVLQLFQSGLNWRVILHKRENFRKAFKDFDPVAVASITEREVNRLVGDASIIRNRRKIESAIQNAKAILMIQAKYGSFAKFLQEMVPMQIMHNPEIFEDVPTSSDVAKNVAQKMKEEKFVFVGPTIIYSYLQSIGLINDHIECCPFKYQG